MLGKLPLFSQQQIYVQGSCASETQVPITSQMSHMQLVAFSMHSCRVCVANRLNQLRPQVVTESQSHRDMYQRMPSPPPVMNPSPSGLRLSVERLSIEVDRASWMATMPVVTTVTVLLVLGWLLAFR
jgi:hypothetical protein